MGTLGIQYANSDGQESWWRMLSEWEINVLFQRNDLTLSDNFKIYEMDFNKFSGELLKSGTNESQSTCLTLPDAFFGMIRFKIWRTQNDSISTSFRFQGNANVRDSHSVYINLLEKKMEATITSEFGETRISPVSTKNCIYLVHRK